MPFKTGRESGPHHNFYDPEQTSSQVEQLCSTLGLGHRPIGISLLFTKEEYDAYPVSERPTRSAYCVMVKNTMKRGTGCKVRLEHHRCDGGTTALGLEPSTDKIESGLEYFSYGLYASRSIARRMRENVQSLHRLGVSTYGTALVPLEQCSCPPDVVIMVTNACQTMRLVQGYEYFTGKKPQVDLGAMQAMCSELTVVPYLMGEMNVSVMCPSTRMLCKWTDNDMAVGLPFELFGMVVEGVLATQPTY